MKRKKYIIILLLIMSLFLNKYVVNAEEVLRGRITTEAGLRLRDKASTSGNKLVTIPYNAVVTVIAEAQSGNGCTGKWLKVLYETGTTSYTGYACSDYIEVTKVNVTNYSKVSFGNYNVSIPSGYEYESGDNELVFSGDNKVYFITVGEESLSTLKANKDSLITKIQITDDIELDIKEAYLKTISGKELLIAKGTTANLNFIYIFTEKTGITGTIAVGLIKEGTIEDEDAYGELSPVITSLEVKGQSGNSMSNMTDAEFDAYLTNQGFPDSYKTKLKQIHKLHPTWVFVGTRTNYSWAGAMKVQDEFASDSKDTSPGNSFLNINPTRAAQGMEGYLSTQPNDYNYYTNKFTPHDGLYWFQANSAAIAHYMDPRYYLTEKSIFVFQDLTYDRASQTEATVKAVLYSDFLKQYSAHFMTAANTYNVSPIFLAALVKQEVGTSNTNICTNGKAGVLSDGVDYTGFYNFFNVGASSSGNPKLKSLQYAKSKGWNTPAKAIIEGSYFISANYIACGQHTLYYQKFNFYPGATKGIWHQYTTNINSLESQSVSSYNSYKSVGVLETGFKFDIPIFTNMPASTPLPPLGNPNNYMSTIKVNNLAITNFDGAKTAYTVNIPYTEKVTISGTAVATTSTITGLGTFDMTQDEITKTVTVKSGNGLNKAYTITIVKEPKVVTPPVEPDPPTPTEPEDPPVDPNENNNNNNNENNNNENNNSGNTNENETQTQIAISEVIKTSSYKTDNSYLWNITYGSGVSTIINNLKKYNSTVSITVKDKNNNPKTSGTMATGDKVVISTGTEEKTLLVVIYGDSSGDGSITAIDLLNVQKKILNKSTLSGAYLKAMDTNKDGKVSAIDLLNVQKHILKKMVISQG